MNGHPMNGHPMNGHPMNGDQLSGDQLSGAAALHGWRTFIESVLQDEILQLAEKFADHPTLLQELDRVSFHVVDEAPEGEDLLGVYIGSGTAGDPSLQLPPIIELYVFPLVDLATPESSVDLEPDFEVLDKETRITVRHELAHHFEMDHDQLDRYELN